MNKNPYKIVNRAIKRAKEQGVTIKNHSWGTLHVEHGRYTISSADPCACVVSCVLDGKKPAGRLPMEKRISSAARILSQPAKWVESLIAGFDGRSTPLHGDRKANNFGKRLRAKHIEQRA